MSVTASQRQQRQQQQQVGVKAGTHTAFTDTASPKSTVFE